MDWIYQVKIIFGEIFAWVESLPPMLRNSNFWSAILGAIVSAAVIDHIQEIKNRTKEVNQFNAIITIILVALETTVEMKRQYAIKIVDDLNRARITYKSTGGFDTKIQSNGYMLQYPPPQFHISKAISLSNKMTLKSGRLLRGMYRLQDSANLLSDTVAERNKLLNALRMSSASMHTQEQKDDVYAQIYGFPTKGKYIDMTLPGLTESLFHYSDDVLQFCLLALRNIELYSKCFLTFDQRRKLFKYEVIDRNKFLMPAPDHLKELIEGLTIPPHNKFSIPLFFKIKKTKSL